MSKTIAKVQYKLSTLHGEIALQAGQTNKVKAKGGETYSIRKRLEGAVDDDLANDVVAQRSAADLQLDYADGTRLILQDYFNECRSGADCAVTLAGDAPQGWQLTASSAEGAVLADGSTLLYAHGSPQALGSMTLSNPGLEQSLAGLQGEWITYVPQSSFGASGWVTGGLLGLGGLAAGGGSAAAAAGSPVVQNFVKLAFVGGPALAGNDLSIEVYRADGKTLIGIGKLGADGSVTIDAKDYMGVVVVKLINGGNAADYLDEATGTGKDLGTQLYSMGLITEPNSIISLNVNVLTTLAYAKAQEALGGSLDKPVPLTASQIEQAAKVISGIFQVGDVLHTSVLATNGGHYNPDDGLSAGEKYGSILAAISGAEKMGDKTVQQVLDDLLSGIKIDGQGQAHIDKQTQDQLIAGGHEAGSGSVSGIVDTFAPVFTSGIAAKAVDENSGEGQVVYTAQASDTSGVSYSLGGADAAALRIDAATGKVTLTGNPDYEAKSSYSFTVIATDAAGNHSEQVVTLGINDLPEVRSVAITGAEGAQNDTLSAGDVVSITVTMDNATFVDTTGGTPRLALQIGGSTVYADYASGSGSTALVFQYTIEAGQTDANGISIAANSLSLNGGTLKDAAGHTATLSHEAVADHSSYLVDAAPPAVTLVQPPSMVQLEALNNTSGGDKNPQITALGSKGAFVVTWYGLDSESRDGTFVQRFNADGSQAGETVQLEALIDTKGSDRKPQITALGSDGAFVVTWHARDGEGDRSIFVQRFNADGSQAGDTVQLEALNNPLGDDYSPQITALGSDGAFVVTWYGMDSERDNSIFVQLFNADGSQAGETVQLEALNNTQRYDSDPQITALGSDGAFVVTWFGLDSELDESIFVQRFNADGSQAGETVQLEALNNTRGDDSSPQITVLGSDGAFVVTWQGADSEGDTSIFVQRFNADGSQAGETVQLEALNNTQGSDSNPQIMALGSDGAFVVTWQGEDSEGDNSIFVQRFNADGSQAGETVQLEALNNTQGHDSSPQITALGGDGAFVVTWTGVDSEGDYSIYVQRFNADGSQAGKTVQLEALNNTRGSDEYPQIMALGSDGAFVVTWHGVDSKGDSSIFVQRFNADGTLYAKAFTTTENATVQSTEEGTVYLVHESVTVSKLADITSAADSKWNSVIISAVNTDTALALTGLADGKYYAYAVDKAGNLSPVSSNPITIDGPPVFVSAATATAIDENSGPGLVVYTAIATDSGAISYSLKAGSDASAFSIDASTGKVTLTGNPNFEAKSSYSFTVIATDAAGNHSEQVVTLGINDLPEVRSVAITGAEGAQNDTLSAGDVVSITVTMDNATFVDTTGGTPRLALQIGGSTVYADYASGSGSTALVFQYTIEAGQTDANGISIAANSLSLNGGTLKDAAGHTATLSHEAVADHSSYLVDAAPPAVTLVQPSMVQLEALNNTRGYDFYPQITALGSKGAFVVTWYGVDSERDLSIFVQRFNADGSQAGETVQLEALNNTRGADEKPQITALGNDGAFVVTWQGVDSEGDYSIFVQRFNADGSQAGNTVQLEALNNTRGEDSYPQITVSGSDGAFVVTWQGYDSEGDTSIFVQRFNADGSQAGETVQLEALNNTLYYDSEPQITALGSDGAFVVTWYGLDSKTEECIYVQRFNADGSQAGETVQLAALNNVRGSDKKPQITALGSDGAFVVTWYGQDSEGDRSIFVQRFNADGSQAGETMQLEALNNTRGSDEYPQITALGSDGAFVVTWQGIDSEGDYSIFVQRFNADGSQAGETVQLEALNNTRGSDEYPQITALGSDGAFVVTWQGVDSEGDYSIFVQRFNADGSQSGKTVQLEPLNKTRGHDAYPQITALGNDGAFVVTWKGMDSEGDDSIFVQRFNADGTPYVIPDTTLKPTDYAIVQSTVKGTVYLVHESVTVSKLADITSAADSKWNSVTISAVNTDTALALTGLADGKYYAYAVDKAGNLSPVSSNPITIDGPPVFVSDSTATAIDENSGPGLVVYTAIATDSGVISYSLKAGGDAAAFTIDAQGNVKLLANPDYETKSSYSFTVVATDATGKSSQQEVSLTIKDVDEDPPVFTSGATATAIDENSGAAQMVYKANATDASAVRYSLAGADATKFRIDAKTGAVTLIDNPDYETQSGYAFTVVAIDALGNQSEQKVTLNINDVDDTPPVADLVFAPGLVQLEMPGRTDSNDRDQRVTALGNHGDYAVAWISADAQNNDKILVQRFQADGSLVGEPVQLGTGYSNTLMQITALGNDGSYVVTWQGWVQDEPRIFVQRFNADGSQAGSQESLGEGTLNTTPQITALGSDGAFVLTWNGTDGTVLMQRFDANGQATGAMEQLDAPGISNGLGSSPQITDLGVNGQFVVVWQGQDTMPYGNDQSIFVQRFDTSGKLGAPVHLEPSGVTNGLDFKPIIAALGGGAFAVTWHGSNGNQDRVFVQRFDTQGQPAGTPVQLEVPGVSSGEGSNPSLAALGGGAFAVAWQEKIGNDPHAFVQRFDASGNKVGEALTLDVPGNPGAYGSEPKIVALGQDGAFAVTWTGSSAADGLCVYVQSFTRAGTPTGTISQLKAPGVLQGMNLEPQITALGHDGAFVVTWKGNDNSSVNSPDSSIFVQRFNADGTPFEPSRIYSPNGSVQVQSNEAGAVYLVHDSVKVAKLADITGTADALWNSVAVKAGTSTALTLAGLADGSYHTYAVDSAGNLSSRGASAITVDSTGPVGLTVAITSATGSHNGWLVAGDKVLMRMTLDEVGIVGGVPQLALDIGGQTRYANYVSGSGSKTLVFEYQIQPGDESLQPGAKYFSGIKVPANALQFGSGASLMDSLGNLSKGSSATGGSTIHLVDAKAPLLDTAQTTMLTQMENRNHGMEVYSTAPQNEREKVSYQLEGADADRFELRFFTSEKGNVNAMVYWKDTLDQNYETVHSYDLVLVATDQAGNVTRKTLNVQIQDAKGPTVQEIHLTGATGQDNGLINTVGDTVTAAVTFSAAVKVGPNGVPQLKLQIGGQTVYANYVSGSGSEQLVFQYKIVAGGNDADGISVGADALWIPNNGAVLRGDITGLDGTPADLNHGSVADDIRYQVDTKGPEFQGGSTATATAVLENSSITDPIYTAQAINDANDRGGVVSYRLKAEAWTHYNQFVIDADTGEVRFAPGVKPDYELAGGLHAYSFVVEALDKVGNISEQWVTLPVIDVDDTGPKFESAQLGSSQAQKIGSKYWLHAGDVLTISIFADEITYVAGSPQLELDMSKEVLYATDSHGNPYYISQPAGTIRADYVSGSGTTRLDFQYTVQPGDLQESTFSSFELVAGSLKDAVGNDARLNIYHIDSGYNLRIDAIAPVHVSGTQASADAVADDSAVGSLIYTASAIDEQSAVAYSLKAGDDAAMFRIDSVTGKVTLASSLDYGHNASHEYQFTVVAKDVLGNASEQKVTLHVTDHTAPTLVTSTPVDDAGNVAAGSSIVLTFSENVLAGSGSIHIVNDDDPSKSLHIDVADSSQVSISGATVTINPGSDLMAAAKYHVEVETGAFKDVAGNGYAGIGDSTTLNFTVKAAAPQSHTLMVYSEGVYLDNDGNGALSAGDTALLIKGAMGWEYTQAATGTSGFHGVSGDVATINGLQDGSGHAINLAGDAWTVKFFSVLGPALELTGFGRDDSVVVDMATKTHGWEAMDLNTDPQNQQGATDNSWEGSLFAEPSRYSGANISTRGASLEIYGDITKIYADANSNWNMSFSKPLAQGMSDFDFLNQLTFILPTTPGPV